MKKILSLVLALVMTLSLASCGAEPKPDGVVTDFCNAMQKFDLVTMSALMDGADEVTEEELAEMEEEIPTEMREYFTTQAGKMTYSITGSEVVEDTATVTVVFKYSDITPIMGVVLGEYIQQAFAMAFTGASDEAMEDLLYSIFNEKVKTVDATTAETTVDFSCVKTEEGWAITEAGEDAMHVLTCNMAAAFDAFSDDDSTDDVDEDDPKNWIEVPVNTEAELATVKIKVTDCYETDKLTGEYFEPEIAQEGTKFVVYKVEIENISKEKVEFYSDEFGLIDSQERQYELYDDAFWYFDDFATYTEYAPNIKQSSTLVYHVPSDCEGYYFYFGKLGTNDYYKFMGQ